MVCLDCKPGKFALTNVYLCVQAKSIMIVQDILQVWTSMSNERENITLIL